MSAKCLSHSSLCRGVVTVNIPYLKKLETFRVSKNDRNNLTFGEFKALVLNQLDSTDLNLPGSVSFVLVFNYAAQRTFHYVPNEHEPLLPVLMANICRNYGEMYLTLIDVLFEGAFLEYASTSNQCRHNKAFHKYRESMKPGLSAHFGKAATEWIPYGYVGNVSKLDMNMVPTYPPLSLSALATPISNSGDVNSSVGSSGNTITSTPSLSGNASLQSNVYSNGVFIPLHLIGNHGGNTLSSVENDYISALYHKCIKWGKLLKFQQSKDTWRDCYCILDQNRLWFHCPIYDSGALSNLKENSVGNTTASETSPVASSSSTNSGMQYTCNSGFPPLAVYSGNHTPSSSPHASKAYVSYVELDIDTDAVLISDDTPQANAGNLLSRMFANSSSLGPGSSTTSTNTSANSSSVVGSSNASNTFSVTYNSNRSVVRLRAHSDKVAEEWIQAILGRHRTVLGRVVASASDMLSFANGGTSADPEPEPFFNAKANAKADTSSKPNTKSMNMLAHPHDPDNAAMIKAEILIANNQKDHCCPRDWSVIKHLSSFSGMLLDPTMRKCFEEFLLAAPTEPDQDNKTVNRRVDMYCFRFWCYVEDFRCGHPTSSTPFKPLQLGAHGEDDAKSKPPVDVLTWALQIYDVFLTSDTNSEPNQSQVHRQCITENHLAKTDASNWFTAADVEKIRKELDCTSRVPPPDLFDGLQAIVLNYLVNTVHVRFTKWSGYRRRALFPAMHARLRSTSIQSECDFDRGKPMSNRDHWDPMCIEVDFYNNSSSGTNRQGASDSTVESATGINANATSSAAAPTSVHSSVRFPVFNRISTAVSGARADAGVNVSGGAASKRRKSSSTIQEHKRPFASHGRDTTTTSSFALLLDGIDCHAGTPNAQHSNSWVDMATPWRSASSEVSKSTSFGYLPSQWYSLLDYADLHQRMGGDATLPKPVGTIVSNLQLLQTQHLANNKDKKIGKPVQVTLDDISGNQFAIINASYSNTNTAGNRVVLPLCPVGPDVLMSMALSASVSKTRTGATSNPPVLLYTGTVLPHINLFCRRYYRYRYRIQRDVAYLIDTVLHITPSYRALKHTMKPLSVLKKKSKSVSLRNVIVSGLAEASSGSAVGVGTGKEAGQHLQEMNEEDSVPVVPQQSEMVMHSAICKVLNSNSYHFTLPGHQMPGSVILLTPARCKYVNSNERYFGKYHSYAVADPDNGCTHTHSKGNPVTISYDMHYGHHYLTPKDDINTYQRCVVVLVEVGGRGVVYLYDAMGYYCICTIHLDKLTEIRPTEQVLHGIQFFDHHGLCWVFHFNGCDEDDSLTIGRRWLKMFGSYFPDAYSDQNSKSNSSGSHLHGHGSVSTSTPTPTSRSVSGAGTGRGPKVISILQEGFISKKGVFNTSFQKRWFILDSSGKVSVHKMFASFSNVLDIVMYNTCLFLVF